MTSERRKSILILSMTLIIGITLGLLVPAFFHKMHGRGRGSYGRGDHGRGNEHKRDWFVGTIYRVARPDSAQAKQIKPVADWAAKRIEAIEATANSEMSVVLDSVRIQLKPILSEEQQKRLDDFHQHARENWRGGRRGGHH